MNKLILIDSDGTLRHNDGSISIFTKETIKKLRKKGCFIVLASGRPRYHAIEISKMANMSPIVISSTGAEIYDYEKNCIINTLCIDSKDVLKLVNCAYENNIKFLVEIGNYEYVTKDNVIDNEILFGNDYENIILNNNIKQCMFIDSDLNKLKDVWKYVENDLNIEVTDHYDEFKNHTEYWFSICNKKATKGNAMIFLKKYLNCESSIAIGNNYNDLSMIETADIGILVDNACDEIKSYADMIISSNDDDGVAGYLESLI